MKTTTARADRGAPRRRSDLLRSWSVLWLWVLPLVVINVANAMYTNHHLTSSAQGVVQVTGTAWVGIACYINARRCDRLHCKVDGTLLPLLSLVGMVNLLGVTSVSWLAYSNAFNVIVVASFVAECLYGWCKRSAVRDLTIR